MWISIFIRPGNQKRKEQKKIQVQARTPLTMMTTTMMMMTMRTIRVAALVAQIPRMIRVKRKTQVTKQEMKVVARGKLIKGKMTSTRRGREMLMPSPRKALLQGIRKARLIKAQAPVQLHIDPSEALRHHLAKIRAPPLPKLKHC